GGCGGGALRGALGGAPPPPPAARRSRSGSRRRNERDKLVRLFRARFGRWRRLQRHHLRVRENTGIELLLERGEHHENFVHALPAVGGIFAQPTSDDLFELGGHAGSGVGHGPDFVAQDRRNGRDGRIL